MPGIKGSQKTIDHGQNTSPSIPVNQCLEISKPGAAPAFVGRHTMWLPYWEKLKLAQKKRYFLMKSSGLGRFISSYHP
jgi:hypothetical protein